MTAPNGSGQETLEKIDTLIDMIGKLMSERAHNRKLRTILTVQWFAIAVLFWTLVILWRML